MSMLYF